MSKKIRTHYDNLKVTRNAPDIVIKAAHKALLQMHHPDKASDKISAERITRILNDARDVLLDPIRRKQHDDWIKEQERHHHPHHRGSSAHRHHEAESTTKKQHHAEEESIGKFLVAANGTANDTETRLMWCRFALGQTWRNGTVQGEILVCPWQTALDTVQVFNQQGGFAGYQDWRMPCINELKTLLDHHLGDKIAGRQFIENRVFPNNPSWVWSSSPYAGYGGGAWCVNFVDGVAVNDTPSAQRAVRLVRG